MVLDESSATLPQWLGALLRHQSYIALFVAAFVAAFVATPLYIALARRLSWVDRPGGRKTHDQAVPTMGGLVVLAVVFAGVGGALSLGNRVSEMLREHLHSLLAAMACTAVMIAVGVIDDRHGLRARTKLLAQVVVAVAAFLLGFRIAEVTVPLVGSIGLGAISLIISVLWIVGITNAVNLTDGLDGLAVGVSFLAAAANAAVAIWLHNYYMAVTMLLLAGALLGFLRWNFHPARVFLGDTGSLGLGMFLALCSIHSAQKAQTAVMILVPLCALGYPIFDTLLTVARRTVSGQPLFASDREHVHHRLLTRGYGVSGAALRIYAASVLLMGIGVMLSSMNHLVVGLGLLAVTVLAWFSVRVLGYMEWSGWIEQFRGRDEMRLLHAAAALARLKIAAARNVDQLLEALGVFATELGASGIDVSGDGESYRWVRGGSPAAGRSAPLSFGCYTGHMEGLPPDEIDPRARALLDDLCRLAAQRCESWTLPSPRAEVFR